ncbi:MAG TPA: hypothetical protein VNM22_08900 [Candidatus Limnocylindrales bacterium]|nr:hypothetical protein [Candidatus Limnocylindrales bacterium]
MRYLHLKSLGLFIGIVLSLPGTRIAPAANTLSIQVTLQRPDEILKMGNTPTFIGTVKNLGPQPLKGLTAYIALLSLEPGKEHPVDLEDWSAQTAIHIHQLSAGETHTQGWDMRLIQAGKFGILLTVINPQESRPIVSDLIPFDIQPKPTLASDRILFVSIGEPLFLLFLFGSLHTKSLKNRTFLDRTEN